LAAPLQDRLVSDMEIVVLVGIAALLFFGPRRGGRMPSPMTMICGAVFLAWFLVAFGMGSVWKALVGTFWQP
jgi:hypothetical protein